MPLILANGCVYGFDRDPAPLYRVIDRDIVLQCIGPRYVIVVAMALSEQMLAAGIGRT